MEKEIYATIGGKEYTKKGFQKFMGISINSLVIAKMTEAGKTAEEISEIFKLDLPYVERKQKQYLDSKK